MTIRLVVAVIARKWFEHLRVQSNPSEVNFWAPGAAPFKALQAGELFLFNGRHNEFEGQTIAAPTDASWSPDPKALRWHSTERFRG